MVHLQPIPIVIAGLGGTVLGVISAASWLESEPPAAASAPASREARLGERRSGELPAGRDGDVARRERASSGSSTAAPADAPDAAAAAVADAERLARTRELGTLRARERAAQNELTKARARIARLEREIEQERAPTPARTRHEYDLTREDWKKMAAQATVKYRVPCPEADWAPSDANLAALGLAPEDYAVVRDAFASSAARQREALLPLCASALGGRVDVARALNLDSCRAVIFSTASQRAETPRQSAQHVASFMAGDGPRPEDESALTERTFLALAEESARFEAELAAAFGPDEAHHITFSDTLCFSRSSYSYGPEPSRERQ